MAREPFLINPAPRKKRGSNPLPSGLLKAMIKKHGPKKAMAEAWKSVRGGSSKAKTPRRNAWPKDRAGHKAAATLGWAARRKKVKGKAMASGWYVPKQNPLRRNKWPGHKKAHSTAAKSGWARRHSGASGSSHPYFTIPRHNPFLGEEVIVVGMNPKTRKRRKARKSRRSAALSRFMHNPRRRSVRRRARNSNPRRRRAVAVTRYRRNPVRRARRRVRRNPVSAMTAVGGGLNIMKPQTLIMPLASVLVGRLVARDLPGMIGMGEAPGKGSGSAGLNLKRTGVQVASAIGGGMLLKKFAGQQNATFFAVTVLATAVEEVIIAMLPGGSQLFAFPLEESGMGAYVEEDYGGGNSPY